jgi:hypothetical protein
LRHTDPQNNPGREGEREIEVDDGPVDCRPRRRCRVKGSLQNYLLHWGSQPFLLRLSNNWMRSPHIIDGILLYEKAMNLNVTLT